MKIKYSLWALLGLALFLALFTLKGVITLDPDFGYRLRTGQMIASGIVPKTDPYTYTMPSFPYVEHAVSVAVMWATLYPKVGRIGISIVHALVALAALIIATKRVDTTQKSSRYNLATKPFGLELGIAGIFPVLLAFATILPFAGIRAQTISWIFISVFFYVILNRDLWKRFKLFTPLFFLLWANTHGSWSAALAVLGFLTAYRSLMAKKILWTDGILTLTSLLITLINPYGIGVWREVWSSLSDSSLRWRILEWMPSFLFVDLSFIAFFTISTFFVVKYRKYFLTETFLVYTLVLSQAILSRRHIPLWIFLALPMTIQAVWYLFDEIKPIKFGEKRFKIIYKYAWIFSIIILVLKIGYGYRDAKTLSEQAYYPVQAIAYLNEHTPEGEIFSTYSWGGYLIWKMPEKKVFIDGRMPSWKRGTAPENELTNAYTVYEEILKEETNYKDIFENFNVRTVLINTESSESDESSSLQIWYESILTKLGHEPNHFDFQQTLRDDGWETIYKDSIATIYQK